MTGCLSMSSCRSHVPAWSWEIVTFGAVRAVAEGVADGLGGGVVDGVGEPEGTVLVEAPVGSTLSCPLWAGPQALSARLAARHIPRARRRALEGVRARSIWWWCGAG